jgi:single-strand DNA-binding protein
MLNKIQIIGRLGADPEVKQTTGGTTVCRLRVAVTETFKDRDGNKKERAEWFTLKAFGKTGEILGEHCRKGRLMYFEGRQETEQYEKDGTTKYVTFVNVRDFAFLGRREQDDDGNSERNGGARDQRNEQRTQRRDEKFEQRGQRGAPPTTGPQPPAPEFEDDIPF